MSEQSELEQIDIPQDRKPQVLESNSVYGDGRITFQTRPNGDFDVKKTGSGNLDYEVVFIDFKNGQIFLPLLREALPPLAELYPEPPHSSGSAEQHIILPGEERAKAFRERWLQPHGANTAPLAYLRGDQLKKEIVVEQTAAGNLIITEGAESASFPMHDRMNHMFGDLALPEDTFKAFSHVAQQVPDLAKRHPEAADTVRKAIAQAIDASTSLSEIYGEGVGLPSLDVLNELVLNTDIYSNSYHDSTGNVPNDFVRSVLSEKGFDVAQSPNSLDYTRETQPSGRAISFVSHISQKRDPTSLVVPKEQELLVSYVPKLVAHLKQAA